MYKLNKLATNKVLVVKNPCCKKEKYLPPKNEIRVLKKGKTRIIKQ
jgi:hypothetical protein